MRRGDADLFRRVWGGIGSTVALIATEHAGQRFAMLATAVTSVSMDPPSLLICINRSASAFSALRDRGAFSLGILPAHNHAVGAAIAKASKADRFLQGNWSRLCADEATVDGLPWLTDAQATLFCVTDTAVDYGTHRLFVARIAQVAGSRGNDPLLYCDGSYGRFDRIPA